MSNRDPYSDSRTDRSVLLFLTAQNRRQNLSSVLRIFLRRSGPLGRYFYFYAGNEWTICCKRRCKCRLRKPRERGCDAQTGRVSSFRITLLLLLHPLARRPFLHHRLLCHRQVLHDTTRFAIPPAAVAPRVQSAYDHAIREFIDRYCPEPWLAFNRTVVTRYRIATRTPPVRPFDD